MDRRRPSICPLCDQHIVVISKNVLLFFGSRICGLCWEVLVAAGANRGLDRLEDRRCSLPRSA
jgi:hypothetical protein